MVGGLISGVCSAITSHVLGLCGPVIGAIANIIIAVILAAWGEISGLITGGLGGGVLGGVGGGVLGGVGGGVLGGLGMGTIDAIISLASEVIMAMLRGLISGIHIPW